MNLTSMQILKTEAGRDLDALVAEHVMGWVWLESHAVACDVVAFRKMLFPPEPARDGWVRINYSPHRFRPARPETLRFSDWDRGGARLHPDGHTFIEHGVPHYSTDIAPAWQVAELTRLRGHEGNGVFYIRSTDEPDAWLCGFEVDGNRHAMDAPTAELAICRAALMSALNISPYWDPTE